MKTDFTLKTKSAAQIAAANKRATPATSKKEKTTATPDKRSEETTMVKEANERVIVGTDHHGHKIHEDEGRDIVGTDDYDRPIFEGQVAIKDGHGNTVYQEPWVGKGPKAGPDNIDGEDDE